MGKCEPEMRTRASTVEMRQGKRGEAYSEKDRDDSSKGNPRRREVEECLPRWRSPRPEMVSTAVGCLPQAAMDMLEKRGTEG
jgi:hypothetical protein